MQPRGGVVRGRAKTRQAHGSATGTSSTRNGKPVKGGSAPSTTREGGPPAQRGRGTISPRGSLQPLARGGKIQSPAPSRPSTAQGQVGSFQQRYDVLKKRRETERANAIRDGFLADPDRPRTLAEAITPVGTCSDMCPEFERVERVVQNDVMGPEIDPATADTQGTSKRLPDEARMVKKFRRAAAGLDEQLPSDLRPPHVLKKTLDYLFNDLLQQASSLSQVHHFIWDRTRAVRNDFSIQQVSKVADLQITIECYERIARFHILSLHQLALAEKPYDNYVAQQEREQLDKTLLSLMQLYEDSRARLTSPNEPEFRAYCIIFQIQNPIPDLEDRVQTWPKSIATHPRVQRALLLYAAATNTADMQGPLKPRISHPIAQANWREFWALIQSKELSYLMACVGEIYFVLVRRTALNAVWRSYRTSGMRKVEDWTLAELVEVFGFETQEQVQTFCEDHGFTIAVREDGAAYLDLNSVTGRTLPDAPVGKQGQQKSDVVERKRYGRALSAVINGLSVREAKAAGLVEQTSQADTSMADHAAEESLFITDHSDDEMFPRKKSNQDMGRKATAEMKAQPLNPFASSFNPAQSTPATQPSKAPQSSFGFGNQIAQPFGAPAPPNAFTNGFGSPAPTNNNATRAAGTQEVKEVKQAASNGVQSNSASASPRSSSAAPNVLATDTKPEAAIAPPTNQNLQGGPKPPFSFGSNPSMLASQSSPFQSAQPQQPSPFSIQTSEQPNRQSQQQSPAFSSSHSTPFSSFANGLHASRGEQDKGTSAALFPSPTAPTGTSTTPAPSITAVPASSNPASQLSALAQPPLPTFNFGGPATTWAANTTPQSSLVPHGMPPQPVPNLGARSSVNQAPAQPIAPPTPKTMGPSSEELRRQAQAREAVTARKSALLDQIAGALLNEKHGLLEQFLEFAATPMIAQARQQVLQERANQQADDFRVTVLSQRYARRWRQLTINHKLARQGRDRRRRLARDVEARSQRSRESSIASQVDAFRESFRSSRSSLASSTLTNDPSQQMFDDNEQEEIISVQVAKPQTIPRANTFSTSIPNQANVMDGLAKITPFSPSQARTSRRTRDSVGPSGLSMTSPSVTTTSRHDTTRSTYFKLKALGLDPNSATLHASNNSILAATTNDRKRPRTDSFGTSTISGKRLTTASASPLARSTYLQDEAAAPPNLASGAMQQPVNTDDDDELLVAARQVRQAMTESISLFQEEIAKDELHQSQRSRAEPLTRLSKSLGTQDLRATIASLTSFAPVPSTERTSKFVELPPRCRNRVSKFLPRERHSDVQAHRRRTIGTRSRGSTPNPLREAALEAAVAEESFINGGRVARDEPVLLDDDDDDVQDSGKNAMSPSVEQSCTRQPMAIDPQLTQFGTFINGSSTANNNHGASPHASPQVLDLDDSYSVHAEKTHSPAQPATIPASEAVFGRQYAPEAASFAKLNNDIVLPDVATHAQTSPAIVSFVQPSQPHEVAVKPTSTQPQLLPQAPPQKAVIVDPRKRLTPPASSHPPAEPLPPKAATQDPRKRPSPPLPAQTLRQASPPKPAPRDPRQRPQASVPPQAAPQTAQKAPTRDPRQRPSQPVQSPKLKMQPKQPPRRQVSAPHVNPFALLEGMGDDDDDDDNEDEDGEDDEDDVVEEDVAMEQETPKNIIHDNTFVAANAMQQFQAGKDDTANHYMDPSQLDGGMWDDQTIAKDEAGYSKYFSESEDDGDGDGYDHDDAGMGPGGEVAFDDDDEGEEDLDEDEDEEEEFDEDDEDDEGSMEEEDDEEPQDRDRAAAWGAANGGKSGASVEDAIEL